MLHFPGTIDNSYQYFETGDSWGRSIGYTSKTTVGDILSEVSENLVFAAHEIDSVEPSEFVSKHEHVPLLPCCLGLPGWSV